MRLIYNPIFFWCKETINTISAYIKNNTIHIWNECKINNTIFWKHCSIKDNVELYNTEIWDYTYIAWHSNIINTKIWKFCSIWSYCKTWFWNHPSHFVSTSPVFYSIAKQCWTTFADKNYFEESKQTIIWNDVWIWADVMIFDGIKIWDGAIIWAWAIVNRDVPPYAIVVGVSAKIIKYRFSEIVIKQLLDIERRNKDSDILRKNFNSFHDIENFIKLFSK